MKYKFEIYLSKMFNEITAIDSKFNLYENIYKSKQNNLKELNIAPGFFSLVLDSLFSDMIVSLAKLYENYDGKNRSDKNIIKFLNFIESNMNIFPSNQRDSSKASNDTIITMDLIKDHRRKIKNSKETLDNLFHWRDKYYAHFDNKYFEDSNLLSVNAPLTPNDVYGLLELLAKILNKYSVAYNGKYYSTKATNRDDFFKIIDILEQYNDSNE